MSDVIKTHFEPGELGVIGYLCPNCGTYRSQSEQSFCFDDKHFNHIPECKVCGTMGLGSKSLTLGRELCVTGGCDMPPAYKLDKSCWVRVKPYVTKKGKISEWRHDAGLPLHSKSLHNSLVEKIRESYLCSEWMEMWADGNDENGVVDTILLTMLENFGDIRIRTSVIRLFCNYHKMIVIKSGSTFHGDRKGMAYNKSTKEWIDLDAWYNTMDECGLSMDNGSLTTYFEEEVRTYHSGRKEAVFNPRTKFWDSVWMGWCEMDQPTRSVSLIEEMGDADDDDNMEYNEYSDDAIEALDEEVTDEE